MDSPAVRRRKAQQVAAVQREESRITGPQPTKAQRAVLEHGEKLRWMVIVVVMLALVRLFVSDRLRGSLGLLPLPTWEWDVAAFTPLLALLLLWDAEFRRRVSLLSGELVFVSGFYALYAVPAALMGHWQLWPAVAFSIAVVAGIWHTNRQARTRD